VRECPYCGVEQKILISDVSDFPEYPVNVEDVCDNCSDIFVIEVTSREQVHLAAK